MCDASRRSHHIATFKFACRLAWDRIVRLIELLVVPLLLIGSLILIGIVLFRSFTWTDMAGEVHAAKDRISAENEIFRTLAQIFGGAFVLAGLYFSAKSFAVARQSEVTERLSSALENLGSDSNARRVGGINSLAGLIFNPSADYDGIIRTLCDFIRTETKSPVIGKILLKPPAATFRRRFRPLVAVACPTNSANESVSICAMRSWSTPTSTAATSTESGSTTPF